MVLADAIEMMAAANNIDEFLPDENDEDEIFQQIEEDVRNFDLNPDVMMMNVDEDQAVVDIVQAVRPLGEIADPNPLENWVNILPADIVDHPVIAAFEASNANYLVSNPRIAGNPIIFASRVSSFGFTNQFL
jgi:hypothetical protein